jgi:site-specific DNA recombinase
LLPHFDQNPKNSWNQSMSSNCVIYLRVSSQKQVREGDGLNSQLCQCQEYSKFKQYKVLSIFQDDGISGSKKDRAGLQSMFDFLADKPNTKIVVYDSKRFARAEPLIYYQLMDVVKQLKCRLEYITMQVEDNPIGRFMEGLSGLQANLEREQNAEQVKSRMKARLMNGYWCFYPKTGYKFTNGQGRVLIPNEPFFTAIQKSFLEYIGDPILTKKQAHEIAKSSGLVLHYSKYVELLSDPFYAGIIHYPKWGVSNLYSRDDEVVAKHQPILTIEQYQSIQNKLNSNKVSYSFVRDIISEFPMKGHLSCGICNKLMSCYTTTRQVKSGINRYPLYACINRKCSQNKLGISRDSVHSAVEEYIKQFQPNPKLVETIRLIIEERHKNKGQSIENDKTFLDSQLVQINKEIEQLMNRVMKTTNDVIASRIESQIELLEVNKNIIIEKIDNFGIDDSVNVRTVQNQLLELAKNLHQYWETSDNEGKKNILQVLFPEGLLIKKEIIECVVNIDVRTVQNGLFDSFFGTKNTTNIEWWRWRDSHPRPAGPHSPTFSD